MTAANDNNADDLDPSWLQNLQKDLDGLEATNPKVAAARKNLDQATARILKQSLPEAFKGIDGEELALAVSVIATPTALRGALLDRVEVKELRIALVSGAVTEGDIARWVAVRSQDFKQGEKFPHEHSFCALIVALEALPEPAAKAFIEQMAASQAQELTMLPKVASECLKARIEAKLDPAPEAVQIVNRGTCHCGVEYIVVRQGGKDAFKHKVPVCELFDRTGRVALNRDERRALEARNKK